MTTHTATCSCGQLRVACEGDPVRVSVCHCLECQKRTGAPFGAQARWPTARTTIEGRATRYVRIADSGNTLSFHFCPDCGSTVYYGLDHVPDVVAVALGNFADPTFPAPSFSVYEERKHAWIDIPGDVEHLD
ncbi:MAG: GFA family protein [Rhizomicrobium sp.]